ncbi:MAG: HAD-IIIC family phosphatase [Planctomycetota bacterium]|jgi:FkbH-like protein|nr:HAD-IIIC family phosphatase [Planctomycetota bacterium]
MTNGTTRDLYEALRAILNRTDRPGRMVVVHSSFAGLMPPEDFSPQAVCRAFSKLVDEGWTFAFPAFTFSFCDGKAFHALESPSETGVLADWVLSNLSGAVRSRHPVYSFVAVGDESGKVASCPATTAFGDDSPFAAFERENALLVSLGGGCECFTQCHRYEELGQVPYRHYKKFTGVVDYADGNGRQAITKSVFVRDWRLNPQSGWHTLFQAIRARGGLTELPLWRGRTHAVQVGDVKKLALAMLNGDKLCFLENAEQVREKLAPNNGSKPLRIALLGHANLQLLYNALEKGILALAPELAFELNSVGFGQFDRELQTLESEIACFVPAITIFIDRVEDIIGHDFRYMNDEAAALAKVERHARLVANWADRNGGWIIVSSFAALDAQGDHEAAARVDRFNGALLDGLRNIRNIIWMDSASLAASNKDRAVDPRLAFMGGFPFSRSFSENLARCLAGYILAIAGKSARVLALDLDDTLWGGALGDDGIEGLSLGGDYPGNVYRDFQVCLKGFAARGISLVVLSRNDEGTALSAMERLGDMAIRPADLVGRRINRDPKWMNIRDLSDELNMSLGSFLFIDDNPVEREEMRLRLPEVKVLDLPDDPAEWVGVLMTSPYLRQLPMTAEDAGRNESYRVRTAVESSRAGMSTEEFHKSLRTRVTLSALSEANASRCEQLCRKTNQFNASGNRHTAKDLFRLRDAGADVLVARLTDKFADYGNIGLIILESGTGAAYVMDTFLLSCRILGRGVEIPLLWWTAHLVADRGGRRLFVKYVATDRNAPVRNALINAGFRWDPKSNMMVADVGNTPAVPEWLPIEIGNEDSPGSVRDDPARPGISGGGDEIAGRIRAIIRELFPVIENVDAAGLGRNPGWDSLSHFSVVLRVEEEFGLHFNADELAETASYRQIVDLCSDKMKRIGYTSE